MSESHHRFVADRYGVRAADYLTSAVHAGGADLDQVETLARSLAPARALDLGCGGGHVAYRLASVVKEVMAADVSPEMTGLVAETAAQRGLSNISVRVCPAEALPFPADAFDLIVSRFSAHHWRDLEAGLRQARRVLAAGGRALFIDSVAPSDPLLDTHLQAVEVLRDPSHVRNYSLAEWTAALGRARFTVVGVTLRQIRIEFDSWVKRTRTPPLQVQALRSLQEAAPAEVRDYFAIEADGSFDLDTLATEVTATCDITPP